MKRIWLHIGMHKTGTTSVQENLGRVGKGPGWQYLRVKVNTNMSQSIVTMFGTDMHESAWNRKKDRTRESVEEMAGQLRRKLERVIRKSKRKNLIISAEGLSNLPPEGVLALKDFLTPLCDEIRVIGYVRPPVGFMTSIFQQKLKHGSDEFDMGNTLPRYRHRFRKFDRHFGSENVELVKFDPKSFPNQCIVEDFCQRLRIRFPAGNEITRVNESLTREACGILFAYRKFGPGYGIGKNVVRENSALIAPLLMLKGSRFRLSPEVTRRTLEECREDVQWMEDRLGENLDEPPVSAAGTVGSEDDLLEIPRESCVDFAAAFSTMYGVEVPPDKIPADARADPREVAAMVQFCREELRRLPPPEPPSPANPSMMDALRRWFTL